MHFIFSVLLFIWAIRMVDKIDYAATHAGHDCQAKGCNWTPEYREWIKKYPHA